MDENTERDYGSEMDEAYGSTRDRIQASDDFKTCPHKNMRDECNISIYPETKCWNITKCPNGLRRK